MRVSIWQQFSSNHSAGFTVVGTFESAEKASEVATKLSTLFKSIHEWHEQHPGHVDAGNVDPIPPEVEFAQQYSVEWDYAVDWCYEDDSPVPVLDNSLILSPGETWTMPIQFITVLKQLGGTVVYDLDAGETLAEFRVKLICSAPDEDTASTIASRILDYLPEPWAKRTPWYQPRLMDYELGAEGSLTQLGKALSFDLHFFNLANGLPALIDYLKAQGCTGITYEFVQGLEVDF